jgi:hypothetical protein
LTDCPHCKKGYAPRYRVETGELVHDFVDSQRRQYSHTICQDDPKWKAKQAALNKQQVQDSD